MQTKTDKPQELMPERLLTIQEAATLLSVAVGTLYHMTAQGRIPCIRLSRRCLRFRLSELMKWMDERAVPCTIPSETNRLSPPKIPLKLRMARFRSNTHEDRS
jgi:excisionase family DNA binding protein